MSDEADKVKGITSKDKELMNDFIFRATERDSKLEFKREQEDNYIGNVDDEESEIIAIEDPRITQKLSDEQLKRRKKLMKSAFEIAFNEENETPIEDISTAYRNYHQNYSKDEEEELEP